MSTFIAQLKARLDQTEWPVVFSTLRNQPSLWKRLQDTDFGQQVLDSSQGHAARFSPGFLGLLSLGQEQSYTALQEKPIQAVAEKMRYEAASTYEALMALGDEQQHSEPSLEQAVNLALALRERHRLAASWEQLEQDLSIAPLSYWRLTLACLFDLIPEPESLLAELLSANKAAKLRELALQALFSNPLSTQEQYALLQEAFIEFQFEHKLNLLREISQYRPSLAAMLAKDLLDNGPPPGEGNDGLAQLAHLLQQSEIHQISGQHDEAFPLLSEAWETSQRVQANLAAKLAESASHNDDHVTAIAALERAALLNPGDPKVKADLLAKQLETGRDEAKRINTDSSQHPKSLIAAARVANKNGDLAEAQSMAQAALEIAKKGQIVSAQNRNEILLSLASLLLEIDLPVIAKQAAELANQNNPENAQGVHLMSQAEQAIGDYESALQSAHLAVALDPQDAEHHRHLAASMQAVGSFDEAYEEWERLVESQDEAQFADQLALAECAFQSGRMQRCSEVCQGLIEHNSDDASVLLFLGKSLLASENAEGAIHLKRATVLHPEMTEAWMALAEYQQNHGTADQAIEILEDALDNVSDSAEIFAALGSIYLEQERDDEALDALRQANELIVHLSGQRELAQTNALQLGRLEIKMGLPADARNTINQAHMAYPDNTAIAQTYGRLLIDLKHYNEALAAFLTARQTDPKNLSLQLDSARAHLLADSHLEQGLALLDNVLASEPKNMDAKILLAETQLALGQTNKGRKNFEAMLKSPKSMDGDWQKRISLGMASAEAKGGFVAEAITTLEDLQKTLPKDLDVLRALCTTYCESGREEEAFQIAHQVYLSSAQDEENVLWYAEMAQQAGKVSEAEQALSKAIHAGDQSNQLVLRLAKLQWMDGKKTSARETFASLLNVEKTEINHLLDVAEFLRDEGEGKQAINYVQKAIDVSEASDASLFGTLSEVLIESNQIPKALKNIELAIKLAPNNPRYLVKKSELLQRLERPQAALQSLDEALELLPKDAKLLEGKARLLMNNHDWASALNYAEKAVSQNKGDIHLLLFAAHLAAACLQHDRARSMIAQSSASSNQLEIVCLDAELALESGDSLAAAQAFAQLPEEGDENPRLLSLQSRLAVSSNDYTQADQLFKKALKALGTFNAQEQNNSSYLATQFAVAQAAQAMNSWETAIKLFKQVATKSPTEARAQFALAKALIQRAEWQQLCQTSKATRHAPGEVSLSKASYRASLEALKLARRGAPFATAQAEIARWQARSDLRFDPKSAANNLPQDYPQDAAEAAALVFAAKGTEDALGIEQKTKAFGKSPEVLIELASAYATKDAALALQWAKKATQLARQQTPYYMILARIAWLAGEIKSAFKAGEKALALWPKEPRWQALMANWLQEQDEQELAIEHLEKSHSLDPTYAPTSFELGLAYSQIGAIDKAITLLDEAHQLEPGNADYLLALAHAQQQFGDLKGANQSAKSAYKLDGQRNSALVIRAELALQGNQIKKAASLIEQAIGHSPQDVEAQRIFADIRVAQGQVEEAISILEQAQKKAEDPIPLQIRRAQILPRSRGEGSDLKALQILNERFPERADVAMALSKVMALAGDLTQATQVAHKAMKQAKQLTALEQARLHLHLGQLLKHDGQLDQALHHLDEAAKVAKHLAEIHIERGQVFLARRQHDQAMLAFEQASEAAPNDAQPVLQAALAQKEAKDYAAAEKGLRRAAELAPGDRSIQRQLAALIALNLVHQPEQIGTAL